MSETGYTDILQKRKKATKRAGIIFILLMLFLTFFSKTINHLILPQVEYATPYGGALENRIDAAGVLEYLNTEKVCAYGNWTVKEIKVKVDAQVKKGDILAVVDAADNGLEIEKKKLEILSKENELQDFQDAFQEIDILQYEKDASKAKEVYKRLEADLEVVKSLYESGAATLKDVTEAERLLNNTNEDYEAKLELINKKREENIVRHLEYERDVIEWKQDVEIRKRELEKLKSKQAADGTVRAAIDGVVKLIRIKNGDATTVNQVLFEIASEESRTVVRWKLGELKAEKISIGDTVSIRLRYPQNTEITAKAESKEFVPAENAYSFTASVDNPGNELQYGQQASIGMTKRSVEYEMILPNSSILDLGGKSLIYLLREQKSALGEKLYVQRLEVKVLESDDMNSAIMAQPELQESEAKVVAFSTKILSDGVEVKLK